MNWPWRKTPEVATERLILRLPKRHDYAQWFEIRSLSREFLFRWEPTWSTDHLSPRAFKSRVYWARKSAAEGTAFPFLVFRKSDQALVGGITLDHIRKGPSRSGNLGYWVGARFARKGYMSESIAAVVRFAFSELDLSRVEAACLPENNASRRLLEKSGFEYEGTARGYLKIAGRWSNHALFAILRGDRRQAGCPS